MSTEPYEGGFIPELTLGWRLKMALSSGGVSRKAMAEQLGYEETQLSRWTSDKAIPRKGVISQWALTTGVNRTWLETGDGSPTGPDGLPDDDREAALAKLASKKRAQNGAPRVNHWYPEAA